MKTHEHTHSHAHSHHHHDAGGNIGVAFFLNLGFSIIEIFGGLLTNSVAILSDALHDLGDSFSLALAWYFQKLSKRQRNAKYSYGYRRFSLLGAFINSFVLLGGSVFIIFESVQRLLAPEPANAQGMFLLAVLGIAINGAAMLRLKRGSSINERVVSLHLLEDVLGWAAVLVGSVVMMFVDVPILDPILSLAIACYILTNIYRNLRNAFRVILQGTPEEIDVDEIEKILISSDEILGFHDLHLWTMDGEYNILSAHLLVRPGLDNEAIAALRREIKTRLRKAKIQHATLEFEQEECNDHCN